VTDPDRLRFGSDAITNETVVKIHDASYYLGNESGAEVISIPNQMLDNYSVTVFGEKRNIRSDMFARGR
jgi:hypothetical protein